MNVKHIKPDNFYHVVFKNEGLKRSKCVGATAKQAKFWCMNGSAYIRNEDGSPRVFKVNPSRVKKFKSSVLVKRNNEYAVEFNGTIVTEGTSFQDGLATFKANVEFAENDDCLELIKTKEASGKVCDKVIRDFSPVEDTFENDIIEADEQEVADEIVTEPVEETAEVDATTED